MRMPGAVGALSSYGPWALGATIALLATFFLLRGRVRIDKGWAGFNLVRFTLIERIVHWLLALSFVVLAATALTMQFGSTPLIPLVGNLGFAEVLRVGGTLHGAAVSAFTASLLLAFLLWARHSLPHWRDVIWLLKGGGILVPGWHAPAWKFNAGQKLLFWATLLGGVVLSVSGIVLAYPSQAGLFTKLLALLNVTGLQLPTELTPAAERQYAAAWHGAAALGLTCVALVHIYVRTIGTQGAFSAMGTGQVDANWARQHHSLWADRELKRMDEGAAVAARPDGTQAAPAE
jgi:formate dehydrogenase subunit gamma